MPRGWGTDGADDARCGQRPLADRLGAVSARSGATGSQVGGPQVPAGPGRSGVEPVGRVLQSAMCIPSNRRGSVGGDWARTRRGREDAVRVGAVPCLRPHTDTGVSRVTTRDVQEPGGAWCEGCRNVDAALVWSRAPMEGNRLTSTKAVGARVCGVTVSGCRFQPMRRPALTGCSVTSVAMGKTCRAGVFAPALPDSYADAIGPGLGGCCRRNRIGSGFRERRTSRLTLASYFVGASGRVSARAVYALLCEFSIVVCSCCNG